MFSKFRRHRLFQQRMANPFPKPTIPSANGVVVLRYGIKIMRISRNSIDIEDSFGNIQTLELGDVYNMSINVNLHSMEIAQHSVDVAQ